MQHTRSMRLERAPRESKKHASLMKSERELRENEQNEQHKNMMKSELAPRERKQLTCLMRQERSPRENEQHTSLMN